MKTKARKERQIGQNKLQNIKKRMEMKNYPNFYRKLPYTFMCTRQIHSVYFGFVLFASTKSLTIYIVCIQQAKLC